ncbi:nucleoid-associated protein [Flaviaesturariibacter flavus]|uniref:Nucleoid-associated protein n=1 Tax=Flaviaesturariibacter flavus TaxID=2502780 RepID=A0A4V2NVM7_9BACT|nr:nucleoid-associated protein [Flaviaesturariibacter flavus]TCJ14112.1 nucleoid-associated protein [Flaviaesturariibacter flavus]
MELNTAVLKKLSLHFVGSKNNLDPLIVADKELELEEGVREVLESGLMSRFRNVPEQYAFTHPSSLQFNEVYNYCRGTFADAEQFVELSGRIARHLYEASTHPKVKGGELYVALFEGLPVEGRMHKAIALFKTESKAYFLDTRQERQEVQFDLREGVQLDKIDKGCLIINRNEEEGFDVLLFDNQNRGEEALYWKEGFLNVEPQRNEFHHTAQFLTLTKQFITEQLESEHGVGRKEQVELLHKSIDYFRSKESFDIDEFQNEVFGAEDVIDSFRDFGARFTEKNDYDIAAQFDIAHDAVKKQARIFKSVLKLDKNFHIYIHGRTDLIEKGVDMDGRKYYKIYYQDEA